MKKLLISLGLLFLAAIVGASNAVAGPSQTALLIDTTQTVTFATSMGQTGMTVGASAGSAAGTGFLPSAGFWSIDAGGLTLQPNLDFAPLHNGGGPYQVVSGTLNFTLYDGSHNPILTGTLDIPGAALLLSGSGDTLTLNGNLVINPLSQICSTDSPACAMGAQNHVTLVVNLTSHTGGYFGIGQVTLGNAATLVTPEPTTMLLFGTGLLAFGGILRRKLLA